MKSINEYFSDDDRKKIIVLDEVDSTNTYAKELARKGEPSGTVVAACMQTNGKGRLGRKFCSPKDTSVYMSVILRPDVNIEKINLLTPCLAVAASRAVDRICGINSKIKWVNDLYLNGRKFCGILTESSINAQGKLDFAVAGIGLNVRSVKNHLPAQLLEIVTSIEDETGKTFSIGFIAAEILKELNKMLPTFHTADFLDEYRSRMCIIGRRAAVSKDGEERIATAVGISDNAGLIVEYPDGSRDVVTSGEARICAG